MTTDRCVNCKHYVGDLKCMAFPDRIPDEILTGGNMHDKPLKGQDLDIVFESL